VKTYSTLLPCFTLFFGLIETLLDAIITLDLSVSYTFSVTTSFLLTYFTNSLTSKSLTLKVFLFVVFAGTTVGIFFFCNGYGFNHYVLRGSIILGSQEFAMIFCYSLIGTLIGSIVGFYSRKWYKELLRINYNSVFCLMLTSFTGALSIGGSIGILMNSSLAIFFIILGIIFPRVASIYLRYNNRS
jgi:hypothetical protein